jgi:hypothetical protein
MGARSALLKAHGDDFAWSLLDAAPDAVVIVGDGRDRVRETTTRRVFGFEPDLLGRVVRDLLPDGMRAVHRAHRTHRPSRRCDRWAPVSSCGRVRSDALGVPVEIT